MAFWADVRPGNRLHPASSDPKGPRMPPKRHFFGTLELNGFPAGMPLAAAENRPIRAFRSPPAAAANRWTPLPLRTGLCFGRAEGTRSRSLPPALFQSSSSAQGPLIRPPSVSGGNGSSWMWSVAHRMPMPMRVADTECNRFRPMIFCRFFLGQRKAPLCKIDQGSRSARCQNCSMPDPAALRYRGACRRNICRNVAFRVAENRKLLPSAPTALPSTPTKHRR